MIQYEILENDSSFTLTYCEHSDIKSRAFLSFSHNIDKHVTAKNLNDNGINITSS